jgi:phage-related protein
MCLRLYARSGIIVTDKLAPKPVKWVASSKKDLCALPDEVRESFGYAIYLAQLGEKHPDTKPLKGFGGAGVLEVVDNFDGDTYRAVYTVKFVGVIYVLHAFMKKSKKGIETSEQDKKLISERLKTATKDYERTNRPLAKKDGK